MIEGQGQDVRVPLARDRNWDEVLELWYKEDNRVRPREERGVGL